MMLCLTILNKPLLETQTQIMSKVIVRIENFLFIIINNFPECLSHFTIHLIFEIHWDGHFSSFVKSTSLSVTMVSKSLIILEGCITASDTRYIYHIIWNFTN